MTDAATATLSREMWDYVMGGSGAETTLAANTAALARVTVTPRVLTGVVEPDPRALLAGTPAALPVAVAPMAYQRLVHPGGEVAMAGAARAAGVPLVLSTLSSCRFADVLAAGAETWFQLYCLRDRTRTDELVDRADELGCRALVVTVDVPVMARRPRDVRNGFALPEEIGPVNLGDGPTAAHDRAAGTSAIATHTAAEFAPGLSWDDLDRLRARTRLPLVVKGVLAPEDARTAADHGADAVVVSNHGGRQFDGAPAAVHALPEVAAAVGDRCQVLVDSGIRTGTDVLRALALGASGVLVGRPLLLGLATGGAPGAESVLVALREELCEAMLLAGCADVAAARALRARLGGCGHE
ncbi:MAG: alpha-hydroxy acid oxidase [Actinophytocola sp.]|uniref:alpha-hydroxy acid oxidase n=1 Tax=Actinophytocola sp. TaxID=1872138 RepID=UPI003C706F09